MEPPLSLSSVSNSLALSLCLSLSSPSNPVVLQSRLLDRSFRFRYFVCLWTHLFRRRDLVGRRAPVGAQLSPDSDHWRLHESPAGIPGGVQTDLPHDRHQQRHGNARDRHGRDRNQVLLSLGCVFVWFVWRLLSLIVVVDHSCRWTDGGHGDQGGQEGHSEER
jgi:hypothetical protein